MDKFAFKSSSELLPISNVMLESSSDFIWFACGDAAAVYNVSLHLCSSKCPSTVLIECYSVLRKDRVISLTFSLTCGFHVGLHRQLAKPTAHRDSHHIGTRKFGTRKFGTRKYCLRHTRSKTHTGRVARRRIDGRELRCRGTPVGVRHVSSMDVTETLKWCFAALDGLWMHLGRRLWGMKIVGH